MRLWGNEDVLKPYEKYKPISELWITQIPENWSYRKIKYLFGERSEKGFPHEPLLVASQNMGVVPKDIYGNRTVEAQKDLHLFKLVKVGDFVISLRSFQGGIEYAYYQGIISPAYTVMEPKEEISPGYFRHLAKSRLLVELLKMCVTGIREGQNIDYVKLKNHLIPLPPREEQEQIARFLDWKLAKTKKLIRAKKKQISLLNEQKQVIINNAVTKGLDLNVRMKDSGIEWTTKMPVSWRKDKVTRLFDIIGSGTTPSSGNSIYYENATIPWVNSSDLYSESMCLVKAEKAVSQRAINDYSVLKTYPANTIVIAMYGASIGNLAITKIPACCNQACCCLSEIDQRLKIEFAYYLFKACKSFWIERSRGGGQPNISQAIIRQTWLPIPPKTEQIEILQYLSKYESYLHRLTESIQCEINLLQEYRTRLISDVVTGKVDVRSIKIPEYEAVSEDVTEDQFGAENTMEDEVEEAGVECVK